MNIAEQAKTIENVLLLVNSITQDLIELQDEVVKLKVVKKEERTIPKKVIEGITPDVIKDFRDFTNELINVIVEDNSVIISYNKNGQIATFISKEIYDIFINLPDKFDRATVANCARELGIASKNETLLMRFFIYQFKDYCEKISKGAKDKLVIKKL